MVVLLLLTLALSAEPPPETPTVVLVPAGELAQGSGAAPDEPVRAVQISAFRIDRDEVSIADFERFAAEGYTRRDLWTQAGWQWAESHPGGAGPEVRAAAREGGHPVVAVTWYEADAYCRWQGGALPTEAQWERAACGEGDRRFPWGDQEEATAQWYDKDRTRHLERVFTRPVDADPLASPFGLRNAAGNVWEWTADWYHRDTYLVPGPAVDPTGPPEGTWRSLRGGSYMNLASYCTCSHREPARPGRVALTTGFRCAYPPSP